MPNEETLEGAQDQTFRGEVLRAASLMRDHIDTDQIIPSREMKQVSRHGLGEALFAGWRYTVPGGREEDEGFILNQPEHRSSKGLISGINFGCGSSREHAVWALREFGIRLIIAKSFGQIFYANCAKNGILAIALPGATVDQIAQNCSTGISVDLEQACLTCPGVSPTPIPFAIDPYDQLILLKNLDPIGLTKTHAGKIDHFFERDQSERPWVYQQTESHGKPSNTERS